MTVVSFSDAILNITVPSGTSLTAREIEPRIRDGAIQTFIAPVAGEYVLNNALNARVFLRMGEATLDTPTNAPQLVRQNLVYTVHDAFHEVFSYVNVGQLPTIQANVYQTPGETWAVGMISNNDGAYTANFVSPYAGSYTLDVSYILPLTTSTTSLNDNLLLVQNVPKTTFEATALTLAIAENLIQFELFQPNTVQVTVNGTDNKLLEGTPEIRLETVSGMKTLPQMALPLGTGYLVEYPDLSFETPTPNPATLIVSLWATLPANTDDKIEYPIVGNTQFPITVSAPTMTITPSDNNVILRGIQFDATATNLTSAILTDFNARLCLTIFRPDTTSVKVDFSALTTNEFIPYIDGNYTYVATIHDSSCTGTEIAKVGDGGFDVDPLYIGFLNGDKVTTISNLQEGGLREYLPYTAQLGLFVRRDGTRYERYMGDLTDIPTITSDNADIGIEVYTDNAYTVLIQPQIATSTFAFTLTATAGESISLPIYTGISAQNDGAVSVAVKSSSVMLDTVSASQFNNATFAVNIASTQGEETFDATDVNQAGWDVILTLTHEETNQSWQIEPVFDNNQYVATVPIPVAGTYNATVTLKTGKDEVDYPLDATVATGVTLASVGNANTVEEENSYTFTYQWQDSSNAHITTFNNLPPVTFSTTIGNDIHQDAAILPINTDNNYLYPLTFGIGEEGDYQVNVAWTTKAPDGTDFADSAILDPNPLQVGAVSPFSVALDGQKLQTYYTPILPLVSLGLRTERILVANVVLQSDIRTIPLTEAFPNFTEENLIVRLKDGEGVCVPFTDADCRLQADKWDLRLDGGVARLEIRDITDNMPYLIDVALENGVQPIAGYRMRANTSTLPVQLRLNTLTFLMPIFYVVAVLVITSIGFLITRIVVTRRESKSPILEGFLRFEDRDGKRIEWQENLKARNRNSLDIRRDSRLRVVNVRRLVINTVDGKSDEITVRVWWAPPRKWSTFILRALPLDQLRARVKRQLSLDKPESLFAGSTYVVYSHAEKQIATSAPVVAPARKSFSQATDTSMQTASMPTANMPIPTSGLKRPTQYVTPPNANISPAQTPPPVVEQPTIVRTPPAQTPPPVVEQPTIVRTPPAQTPPPVVEQSAIPEETTTLPPPPVTPTEPDSKPLPPPRRKFTDDDDDNPFGN